MRTLKRSNNKEKEKRTNMQVFKVDGSSKGGDKIGWNITK